VAAHRLGQVEAYLTVRGVLSEASTASDGVLSRECSGFYRCRYATLGFSFVEVFFSNSGLSEYLMEQCVANLSRFMRIRNSYFQTPFGHELVSAP
jgi:hypothetical protein